MFMAPAVTPWRSTVPGLGANNPSLRLYTYHRHTGHIVDYTQYYLNLTLANTPGGAPWRPEYRATEAYNLGGMGAGDLHGLLETMVTDEAMFDMYYLYNSVSYDRGRCEDRCKETHLCAISHVDYDDYDRCVGGHAPVDKVVQPRLGDLAMTPRTPVTAESEVGYMHHHRRHHRFHHVPRFMYFVIGSLVTVIIILFFIVAVVCCRRRHVVSYLRQPRYVLIKQDEDEKGRLLG